MSTVLEKDKVERATKDSSLESRFSIRALFDDAEFQRRIEESTWDDSRMCCGCTESCTEGCTGGCTGPCHTGCACRTQQPV